MKVLCVDNELVGLSITVGKWYEIGDKNILTEKFRKVPYIIYDDRGCWVKLSQKYFKNIQQIREDKLNELGI